MRNPAEMGKRQQGGGGRDLLRGHDKKYIFRGLWKYMSHYWYLLCGAVALTLLSNALSLKGTTLAGDAIGAIQIKDFDAVKRYLMIMVAYYIISAFLTLMLNELMVFLSQKIIRKMRNDVFDKLVTLPVGFFDMHQTGEIVSTISYDINTVNESLSHDFLQIFSSIFTIVYSFILMLRISGPLIIVFLITIPASIIFTRIITGIVRPLFRRRSASLGEMNGYAEEMIAGQKTIKAYGREENIISGFDEKNINATEAYTKADCYGTITGPTVTFINNLSLTLVSIAGAISYMSGKISLTGLAQFVLLSRKFSGPINEIANIYSDIQSALAAAERVFRLIDTPPEPEDSEDAVDIVNCRGNVEMRNVRFGYTKERTIIKDLTMSAPSGSVIAIVGPTGGGKTTIINLLMRFYDIDSGSIELDGTDIYKIKRKSLRGAYTMVLQDTWLFEGTVFDNIAYGKEGVTAEEVTEAAKAAHIHSFITKLPDGYNTVISGDGGNISKGQKQLLTIARAMLIDSSMLILDEATSNVDSHTEAQISDAMIRLMKGKTSFVIAHRLSTVRNADLILVVRDGDIVERGTHDELLARNGFYAELYRSQFETF